MHDIITYKRNSYNFGYNLVKTVAIWLRIERVSLDKTTIVQH